MKKLLTCCLLTLALGACTNDEPSGQEFGPMSATGVLMKTDVSLVRRGTHLVRLPSGTRFYAESRTTNLSEFEGQTVYLVGTMEENIPGELPVLVVETVKRIAGSDGLRRYEVPALNLMIRTPVSWQGTIEKQIARFSLPGEESPLLTVRLLSGSSLPPGSAFYVRNRRATRSDPDESVVQEVYILEKGTVIAIQFDPSSQKSVTTADEADLLTAQFEQVLSDLQFLSDQKPNQPPAGTGASIPCGGIAGILCPIGSYCDITDAETGTGRCRAR